MKKIIALVLALAMIATLGLAFASEAGHGSIVINNAVSGHTYTAYQIFAGDWDSSTNKLSNVDWGTGISTAGKTALETAYSKEGPAAVAEAIGSTDADARAFADHIGEGANLGTGKTGTYDASTEKYTISDLADGYYMIVDTYTAASGETDVVLARYMIQKVGEAVVNNKADKPTVEKKIVEGSAKVNESTANIGDTVSYEITSRVPDLTGYKEYYMDFTDTLSKGLTYDKPEDKDSLQVKIGDQTLTAGTDYTLTVGTYSETDGTSIAVHLKDLVSRNYAKDAAVVITYTATVNDKAVIGNTGNPNTVKLEYTNNPRNSGDGTPDNGDDGVKGETPTSTVKTYVTEVELLKVDGSDNSKKLAGAIFNIVGTEINKVIITGERFVKDSAGTYYLLNDGTYTTKAPTEATESKYASTSDKYKKEAYAKESVQETKDVAFQVVTGSNGIIKLTGLKEGTYRFTEIQAPDGYNLLDAPITITITSNLTRSSGEFAWAAKKGTEDLDGTDGKFSFTVENLSGTTLPSTGGIGTTIFYILGGLLVIGAAVILVARRKAQD